MDKNNWIKVEDRLPEIGETVEIKHTHNEDPAKAWIDYEQRWWTINTIGQGEEFNDCYNYDYEAKPITHWRPEQVKEVEEGDKGGVNCPRFDCMFFKTGENRWTCKKCLKIIEY